ncbi:response regulator [Candidatus Parabeggiatoa sp. HSG14]|uniref:response regulator n=1 Tax=Candidatus Parabeggiatoa sp. HSG14 TaxID=3055593 RepID=UPI0025A8E3DA|nr:response regulator [Thiotrichales bacterium HSG14]
MKFYQRISTKLAYSFLLVALIPTIIIAIYALQIFVDMSREQKLSIQKAKIESLKRDIETFLSSTQNDIIFLSQSPSLKNYVELHNTDNSLALKLARQSLEQEFLAFSRSRGIYYQVRYLDKSGQEIVRVDADGSKVQPVAQIQLQNKAHRYYFMEALQLFDKEIFVSPLELNQERGQIERPFKPVIRYAMPVFSKGKRMGIVITNVDANKFLQPIEDALLVDKKGYYLAHPDVNKRWGNSHNLNSSYTLIRDYPNLAQTLLAKESGNISTDEVMLTFQRVLIPGQGHWTLIIEQSIGTILDNVGIFHITLLSILLIAVFFALIIFYFISKNIIPPIENLTSIVERVGTGDRKIRLKVKRADEFGRLETEFNTMLEVIHVSEKTLHKAKEDAEIANVAKSRFLANMSHELRTPLNAIIGYGEMLQEEIADLGEIELSNDIEKIHLAGKFLLSTINDILDISKIEAGKMELYTETFFVTNMVNDVVHTIQPLFNKNKHTLETYSEDLGEMHADLTKVRQVLLNLLSNASKFNEQKTTISINILREIADGKDWIIFRISDNGIGMNVEQKTQLSQIFNASEISPITEYNRSLGLTIIHHFIQMMGGSIHLESELNKGSTFTVRLPAKVDSVQDHLPKPSHLDVAVLEEGGVVLVIDDEEEIRNVLQKYLSKLGYQVEVADSGEEGLRLARKLLPDVITLDVMMPKMDGWEVLSHLKADPELANIPVIILSVIEDKTMGYSLGATDYLSKPVTREQLSNVLQKYHFSHSEFARLVMVIDDEPVNRDMLSRMLRKAGFRVCKVEDGRVALNNIQKTHPDLILLDLQMPEMDGYEFVAKLPHVYDSIPIIVLTAKDVTAEDRLRLNNDNVAAIFQKGSYSRQELLIQVNQLLSSELSVEK